MTSYIEHADPDGVSGTTQPHIVDNQRTADGHRERLLAFVELPAVGLVGAVSKVQASVLREIAGDFGF
jgi:hypothetical protein